jgi:hypothetical protein
LIYAGHTLDYGTLFFTSQPEVGRGCDGVVRRATWTDPVTSISRGVAVKHVELCVEVSFSAEHAKDRARLSTDHRVAQFIKEFKLLMLSRGASPVVECFGGGIFVQSDVTTQTFMPKPRLRPAGAAVSSTLTVMTTPPHSVVVGFFVMELFPMDFSRFLLTPESSGAHFAARTRWARQLFELLFYLQLTLRCSHGDLKPNNLLMDPVTGRLVLSDFGRATSMGSLVGHDPVVPDGDVTGPRAWSSSCPQLHPLARSTSATAAVDQFSFMIILVRVLFGKKSNVYEVLRRTGNYIGVDQVTGSMIPSGVLVQLRASGFDALAVAVINDKQAVNLDVFRRVLVTNLFRPANLELSIRRDSKCGWTAELERLRDYATVYC